MNSHRITESTVEEAALTWFEDLGYAVISGPNIAPGEFFSELFSYKEITSLFPYEAS